jgi:phage recombination protein Bet
MIFFMGICKARGLNPFAKDAYLMKYTDRDPAAIITSIDYFRARAKAQDDCKGWKAGIIVMRDGEPIRSNGLMLEGDKLIGGWFTAKPQGWEEPFELEVNLKPYIKTKQDGSPTRFWQSENQPTMIRKVAESQGLREVWPAEFAKLFVEEEVDAGAAMDMALSGEKNGKASYEMKNAQPAGQATTPVNVQQEGKTESGLTVQQETLMKEVRDSRPGRGTKAAENLDSLLHGKVEILRSLPEQALNYVKAKYEHTGLTNWPLDEAPKQEAADSRLTMFQKEQATIVMEPAGSLTMNGDDGMVECPDENCRVGIEQCDKCKSKTDGSCPNWPKS